MPSLSLARAVAALLTGLVFVTANTAPVVCAAVHHVRHAPDHAAGHHDHGPTPNTGGAAVDGLHTTPPGCTDMSHCGVAVPGVTSPVSVLRVAAAHPLAGPVTAGPSPHPATFSPPTPPPRA